MWSILPAYVAPCSASARFRSSARLPQVARDRSPRSDRLVVLLEFIVPRAWVLRDEPSDHHRACRIRRHPDGGIPRLEDQRPTTGASPDGRYEKSRVAVDDGGRHDFSAGPWTFDLERQHILYSARRRSDHIIRRSTTAPSDTAPLWVGHRPGSENVATVCRTQSCRPVPRRRERATRQSIDL